MWSYMDPKTIDTIADLLTEHGYVTREMINAALHSSFFTILKLTNS